MGYAIFRIAPRKTTASTLKMLKHALREDVVPNAIEDAPAPLSGESRGYGYSSSKDAMHVLQAKIADAKKVRAGWQKSTTASLDILVTASRDDMLSWTVERQNEFFGLARKFVAEKFGGKQNILAAVIHRDEATPHMQIILAPVDPVTGRFSASKMVGGRDQLSQLQTDFHEVCGEPFGLERGQKHTGARHVPIRAFYGAMEKGLEQPTYVAVPPAPTMRHHLTGKYKPMMEAHKAALAKNAQTRKEVTAQATRGRSVHPKIIKRQADIYRTNLQNTKMLQVQEDLLSAQKARLKKQESVIKTESAALESSKAAVSSEILQTIQSLVGVVDRFSATIQPEYRKMLAEELGIELKSGKLLDQIRRSGLADTAVDALNLLDQVTQGAFSVAAQAQHDRPKG